MKCFECKADIEDDSLFCDQCGAKIYLCPDCRVPGKGSVAAFAARSSWPPTP